VLTFGRLDKPENILMRTFHCSNCRAQIFFENETCLQCGSALAYLPDRGTIVALSEYREGLWYPKGRATHGLYRLCENYIDYGVCNWAVPDADANPLCVSCRLTSVIPQLTPAGKSAWHRLEAAKRRLVHTLLTLNLPLRRKDHSTPDGVEFAFLEDSTSPNGDAHRVLTGHDNGLITVNVSEADDVKRERARLDHDEPYRTLLGHFRHEIGHYFWDRLIRDSSRLGKFRRLFGDEREDYAAALRRHYARGAPENWQDTYVSAYATSHPWEDWAETWAHFLHMSDSLETASVLGLSLRPSQASEPAGSALSADKAVMDYGFDKMIKQWLPLTYAMNSLNRGLGLADSYPFVLSSAAIEKLRFVYETIDMARKARCAARTTGVGSRVAVVAATATIAAAGFAYLLHRRGHARA
jgi:hypothetical protein